MHGQPAHAMADTRGALRYLADEACDVGTSSAYEHVLLTLDVYTGDGAPSSSMNLGIEDPRDAIALARRSLVALESRVLSTLQVELLLAMLDDAAACDLG